jgi:hypothetical protein
MAANQKVAPGGIDEFKTVEIGGIQQWISVRGNDPHNPILLYLHGGPGAPMMPESWTYQRPWEDFFTVVQWDQRGSGKAFASAHRKITQPFSVDRIVADAEELIQYLRPARAQVGRVAGRHDLCAIGRRRIAAPLDESPIRGSRSACRRVGRGPIVRTALVAGDLGAVR